MKADGRQCCCSAQRGDYRTSESGDVLLIGKIAIRSEKHFELGNSRGDQLTVPLLAVPISGTLLAFGPWLSGIVEEFCQRRAGFEVIQQRLERRAPYAGVALRSAFATASLRRDSLRRALARPAEAR